MKKRLIKIFFTRENISLYILIILILFIRIFILEPFRIPSGSMQPTILIGDFIFVNKLAYNIHIPFSKNNIHLNTPERGDIVVFKSKNKKNYIKRVIGISGDKINYINKKIYLNGKIIKNKYKAKKFKINNNNIFIELNYRKEFLNPKKEYYIEIYKNVNENNYLFSNIIVPDNSFFVLGDNRDNSEDSRYWGFVNQNDIIGKALIVWMSIDYNLIDIRWNRLFNYLK